MLRELPTRRVPRWISAAKLKESRLPIREALAQSVFYPACGFDGDPIQYLGGHFHSFIYADYGVGRDELIQNLPGFRGYHVEAFRDVHEWELMHQRWTPSLPFESDGDPQSFADWIKPPFAVWSIHQRRRSYGPDHGPDRFSLLYIGGEGVATFQALYYANAATPAVLAIIQPGHAFGGNWTNFENEQEFLARTVMDNPSGTPEYLLYGGQAPPECYEQACWRAYDVPVATLHSQLRMWKRTAD